MLFLAGPCLFDFFFFRWAILQSSGDVFYQNCRSSSSKEIQQQQQWLCKFYHHNTTAAVAAAQVGSNFGILFKTLSRRRKIKILRYTKKLFLMQQRRISILPHNNKSKSNKNISNLLLNKTKRYTRKSSLFEVSKSHLWQNGRCK